MRITLFLVVMSIAQIFAKSTYSQNNRISLNLKNVSVKTVLQQIEDNSQFFFIYDATVVDVEKKVSIELKDESIPTVLDELFEGTNVIYKINNRQIALSNKTAFSGEQQPKSISGKVTDSSGASLPGVSVAVKGTTIGAITDANGNYSLSNVPAKATLIFSFVGMRSQEVAVGNQPNINVTLEEETVGIEEVVAVGYGTQKKASLTGAITTMKTTQMANIPSSNLSSMLANRASGVYVQSGTGVPGVSSSVRIRASSSWNGGSPLFVIDGVVRDQVSFDALDPTQIDDITILKDAASSAIYGSRSANGVFLVTTKAGKQGKPVVQFNSTLSLFSEPEIEASYLPVNQAMDIYNSLFNNRINQYDRDWVNKNNPDGKNWFNAAYRNPTSQKYSLNVSGGTENVNYFVGGSFYNEDGFLPQLNTSKYNVRANVQTKISKDLTITVNINSSNGMRKRFTTSDGFASTDDLSGWYEKLRYIGGGFTPPYINGKAVSPGWLGGNAIDVMKNGGYWHKETQLFDGLVSLEYKIPAIKGLTVKGTYSYNNENSLIKSFGKKLPEYRFKADPKSGIGSIVTDEVISTTVSGSPSQEYIGNENDKIGSYQLNGMITYDNKWDKHHLNAVAVYEQFGGKETYSTIYKYNFPYYTTDQFKFASQSAANTKASGWEKEDGRLSYVGRINYDYSDKYFLSASVRRDGSIKFAPNRRWGWFPSASTAWVVSNENFFKDSKLGSAIDMMKLRFSFGSTGNDAIGGWMWKDLYNASTPAYYLGQQGGKSSILDYGGIPNYDLTWETSNAYNLGIDMTFKRNFILNAELWKKHSYNILGQRILALPVEFGATFPATNYGEVDAKGIDIEFGYNNGKIGKDFTYNIKANFGLATTNVVKKDYPASALPAENPNGKPMNYLIGYNAKGIIRTQQDLSNLPSGYKIFGAAPELGMMNFEDVSGPNGKSDGIIDQYDQVVIAKYAAVGSGGYVPTANSKNKDEAIRNGEYVPNDNLINAPISYGLSINMKYKDFSLDMLWGGLAGYKILYNDPWGRSYGGGIYTTSYFDDAWSETNPNGKAPKIYKSGDQRANGYIVPSTYNIYNGSFLRLKNVNLSYNIPGNILKKVGISSSQIFVGATNLLCLRKFKYYDPESNSFSSYPITTTVTTGINVQF